MAACTLCASTMTTNERDTNKRGGAAALHRDCAELEDLLFWEQKWNPNSSRVAQLNKKISALSAKRSGTATQWP